MVVESWLGFNQHNRKMDGKSKIERWVGDNAEKNGYIFFYEAKI